VEFFTGALFAFAGWWVLKDCLSSLWCLIGIFVYCWVLAGLIAVFVSDLKYRVIPDEAVFSSAAVVLLGRLVGKFWGANLEFPGSFLGSLFSSLGAVLFFLFLIWATKGKGMGMGDVKYVFFMGALLGWPNILVGLILAFLTGAVVAGCFWPIFGCSHFYSLVLGTADF
jgi:prepilin signal peptidase PulO-like enzyme (type II secretory pathway)